MLLSALSCWQNFTFDLGSSHISSVSSMAKGCWMKREVCMITLQMNVREVLFVWGFFNYNEYSPKTSSPLCTHSTLVYLNQVFLSNESRRTLQRAVEHHLRIALEITVWGEFMKCFGAQREEGAVHDSFKFTFCLLPDASEDWGTIKVWLYGTLFLSPQCEQHS